MFQNVLQSVDASLLEGMLHILSLWAKQSCEVKSPPSNAENVSHATVIIVVSLLVGISAVAFHMSRKNSSVDDPARKREMKCAARQQVAAL